MFENIEADAKDQRTLRAQIALMLARCDKPTFEALDVHSAPPNIRAQLTQQIRAERRVRKAGVASQSRQQLAERILASFLPDETTLRSVLDEAQSGQAPKDLCALWFPIAARHLAEQTLGDASALLQRHDPQTSADERRFDAVNRWFDALVREPNTPLPTEIERENPKTRAQILEHAFGRQSERNSSLLRKLSRSIGAHPSAEVFLPVFCSALTWNDYRTERILVRGLRTSPFMGSALVLLLLDPGLRDLEPWRPLAFAPQHPSVPLAALLLSFLWDPATSRSYEDSVWRALGDLGEPIALADRLFGQVSGLSLLYDNLAGLPSQDSIALPEHPDTARALLRIVLRKDPRLEVLWNQTCSDNDRSLAGPVLWRAAIAALPRAAIARGIADEAAKALAKLLVISQARGSEPEDLYRMAIALGKLGDRTGLYLLIEQLRREDPLPVELGRALYTLGPNASEAIDALRARSDAPWFLVVLAHVDAADPEALARIAELLLQPETLAFVETRAEHYFEGLITSNELEDSLLWVTEGLGVCRKRLTSDARWIQTERSLVSVFERAKLAYLIE